MIDPREITVVLQGPVPADAAGIEALARHAAHVRQVLPGCQLILSTWQGMAVPQGIPVDRVLFSSDPGSLPPYKLGACKANNVNRQIVSSAAGLAAVATPYALKLRSDASLQHAGFLAMLRQLQRYDPQCHDRIVVVERFSIDPHLFEQMPFHLSDWFQFGPTLRLQALWRAPLMSLQDATHYRRVQHAETATWFDRRFVARWPAEQHVWRAFAAGLGYCVPEHHNHDSADVLRSHDRFLAREVVVLGLSKAGVQLPELAWAERSGLQRFNCITHLDWLALAANDGGWTLPLPLQHAVQRRQRVKHWVRRIFQAARPLVPVLVRPPFKPVLGHLLRVADAGVPLPPSNTTP